MEQKAAMQFKGRYDFTLTRADGTVEEWTDFNLIPNEGLNLFLNTMLNGATQSANWYVGLCEGVGYTPTSAVTASGVTNIVDAGTETTTYTDGVSTTTRPQVTFPTSTTMSSAATDAVFSINATKTITAVFITNVATKSSKTGTLLSAAAISPNRAVQSGDSLTVRFSITAASV